MGRKPWALWLMELAEHVATRATCPRASVGCVLVQDNRVIATGYNGAAPRRSHCTDVGCDMHEGHCIRAIHAEINAIGQAAQYGISTEGAVAYVTHTPCVHCQQALIAAGIRQVVMRKEYHDNGLMPPLFGGYL